MPVDRKILASDQRLKRFQADYQKLPKAASDYAQCRQLDGLAADITAYDRQRAKPVHRSILSQIEQCQKDVAQSDARMAELATSADRYSADSSTASVLALSQSMDALEDFDQPRVDSGVASSHVALGQRAQMLRDASDARLNDLRTVYNQYLSGPSLQAESEVIELFEALEVMDSQRQSEALSGLYTSVEALVKNAKIRQDEFTALEQLSFSRLSDRELDSASRRLGVLTATPNALLSQSQRSSLTRLRNELNQAYGERVQKALAAQLGKSDPLLLQSLAERYAMANELKLDLSSVLTASEQQELKAIAEHMANSDRRLAALAQAAAKVDASMNSENLNALLKAHQSLSEFDRERFSQEHHDAQTLVEKAQSGVLESDERLSHYYTMQAAFSQYGCTKDGLAKLRRSVNALTDLDRQRGGQKLSSSLSAIQSDISRSYCLQSNSIKPALSL
ncbi:hypothetical protein [Ferrimonas pelagia]|uniref:Uncharacterized protein n=1 Tax=Ferrimonas pelagia TaxID=1177826 RepID=A0ABP9ED41_9GAMM